MLTRIEFENFRGFRKLTLEGLRRVNLVVGKNNSGKTSLLEGTAALLNPVDAPLTFTKLRQLESHLQSCFASRFYSKWVVHDKSAKRSAKLSGSWGTTPWNVVLVPDQKKTERVTLHQDHQKGTGKSARPVRSPSPVAFHEVQTCVVSAHVKDPQRLVQTLGSAIRRQGGEELLESALHSVDQRIRKVRIVPDQKTTQVVIDIGLSQLIPISQVGQGTFRLVEMFAEVIGSDARVAFVDELENGIHHTCLIDVWRGIAEAAERFNVQVFATTHSHECIEAAHTAFIERTPYEFAIIQLFREAGEIQGRVLDQQHIAAAIAGDIDLRA